MISPKPKFVTTLSSYFPYGPSPPFAIAGPARASETSSVATVPSKMRGLVTGRTLQLRQLEPGPSSGAVNGSFTTESRDRNFTQFADVDISPMPARIRARISRSSAPESISLEESVTAARRRLDHRTGLNVPYEWWPGAATLKAIEAAGFRWVQVA